jgi:hypothetical protein
LQLRPTGSPEAVAAPGSHRTWRADFPHRRSPTFGSQHCKRLQLLSNSVRSLIWLKASEASACPAAAAQHSAPVSLHCLINFYEAPEISGDAVIGIVAAQDDVDFIDLVTEQDDLGFRWMHLQMALC